MGDKKYDLEPEEQELLEKFGTSPEELRAQHADCPSPQLLVAAQSGVLPEETDRGVKKHMAKCVFCRLLGQDLMDEELAGASPREESRVHRKVFSAFLESTKIKSAPLGGFWILLRRAAPIAALAAVVLAVLWVRFQRTPSPNRPPRAVALQPGVPAGPSVFQWEKLPVKLEAATTMVWRGAPRRAQERYAAELGEALGFYNDDNLPEAARRLNALAGKYPRRPEAHLYLGVCQLYLQENAEAVQSLKAAQETKSKALVDDATWYLALGYERSGEKPAALAELRKLCGGKSNYAARACAAIVELEAAH